MVKKALFIYLPLIIWCCLIFLMSGRSQPDIGPTYWTNFAAKKFAHLVEYAILAVLSYRAFRSWKTALFFTALYGASDEFHQSFVPGREPRVRDVLIDILGGGLGLWLKKFLPPKVLTKLAI